MIDLSGVAREVFQIMRSYDYEVLLYDDDGRRVAEPEEARRMFARPANLLVSIVDEGDDSAVRLFVGKSTPIHAVRGLAASLRTAASKFGILFNMRRYGREISLRDFASKASVREADDSGGHGRAETMDLTEGMYGTSRSSYLTLENARMIVRHSARIEPERIGARGRNVERIFVEDKQGQRFLFPTTHLAPARAMAQHVNQGGAVDDDTGRRIAEAAEEYAALSRASRHVLHHGAHLSEEAHGVREACRYKMKEMRRTFERLYRPSAYADEAARMGEGRQALLTEDGMDARVDEVRRCLSVEGQEALPDRVYEAACRAVLEGASGASKEPMVSVLGKLVGKAVWDDLKAGKLALTRQPTTTDYKGNDAAPAGFADRDGEIVFKLQAITGVVADHSMVNFLSHVANELPHQEDAARRRLFRTVAIAALRAAGMSLDGASVETREFVEWVDRVSGADPLMEMPYPDNWPSYPRAPDDYGPDARRAEEAVESLHRDFDPLDFLESAWGNDFDWRHREHMRDADPDDRTYPLGYFLSSLEGYLSNELARQDVHVDDTSEDARLLFPRVRPHLERAGYIVQPEGSLASVVEGEELTREDVLLPPRNKGIDLKREVTVPDDSKKPGALRDSEMERIKTLAGLH